MRLNHKTKNLTQPHTPRQWRNSNTWLELYPCWSRVQAGQREQSGLCGRWHGWWKAVCASQVLLLGPPIWVFAFTKPSDAMNAGGFSNFSGDDEEMEEWLMEKKRSCNNDEREDTGVGFSGWANGERKWVCEKSMEMKMMVEKEWVSSMGKGSRVSWRTRWGSWVQGLFLDGEEKRGSGDWSGRGVSEELVLDGSWWGAKRQGKERFGGAGFPRKLSEWTPKILSPCRRNQMYI